MQTLIWATYITLPSTAVQLSPRILTVVMLQFLGSYVLFGRSCPVSISSLVGLISPLHMKEHSLTITSES